MGITGKVVTFSNSLSSLACKATLAREACYGVSTQQVRWQRGLIKIVLSSYMFSKTRQNKRTIKNQNINCFLQICMALNLFLHRADLMPGLYTETKACGGSPPPKYERIQRIVSIYKCWLGRRPCLQFYSPTADYLKTRSAVQKPAQQPRAEHLCSHFQGSCLLSLRLLLSMTRLLRPRCSHVSSVLIMVYFPHRGLGLPFLVLLHISAHHYGRLSGPNGTTSNSSN